MLHSCSGQQLNRNGVIQTSENMPDLNYGENNEQILKNFREICSSHIQMFKNTKNHIQSLLGSSYPYQSGIFRESLLRSFLTDILPQSLSIDTGFIYGFDEYENSKQIDILIWNSHKYSPIYRTKEFVIVPPDSVVAVIEVKSKFNKRDLLEGLTNLLSVAKLDIQFREKWVDENNNPILPPIGKFLVTYKSGTHLKPLLVIFLIFINQFLSLPNIYVMNLSQLFKE